MTQQATNNADTATNSDTLSPCPFLLLETSCENGNEGDETFGSCTAFEPVTTPPFCDVNCPGGPSSGRCGRGTDPKRERGANGSAPSFLAI